MNKCCYCGTKVPLHVSHAHIEHFRPKTAVTTLTGKVKPGYYWLVAEWSNLLYACPLCNENKDTHFPVSDERQRKIEIEDILEEKELLVNISSRNYRFDDNYSYDFGCKESWISEAVVLEGKSEKGWKTISICKLSRPELNAKRMEIKQSVLKECSMFLEFLKLCEQAISKDNYLVKRRYCECAKDFLNKYFSKKSLELEHYSLRVKILEMAIIKDSKSLIKFNKVVEKESQAIKIYEEQEDEDVLTELNDMGVIDVIISNYEL
ncbi:hypothetical protein PWEIH_11375 [Listeria weihenstephanensis FSL R9-0317]|nr:hypothetical protein PWEIH_11375 [Listeria weihenstephanensis FSL R9-0317]